MPRAFGDEFEAAEASFKKAHENDPALIKEVEKLMSLLSTWHIKVMINLFQNREEMRVKEVEQDLDKRFERFS